MKRSGWRQGPSAIRWVQPKRTAEIRPVGDVIATIQCLRDAGLSLAVATGDDRHPTEVILSLLGIADDMAVIVCGDDPLPDKPDPAALFHIGSQIGVPTRQMLMVGNTVNDMLSGRNAAVAGCIGINGNSGDPERLAAHADVVLSSIEQMHVVETTRRSVDFGSIPSTGFLETGHAGIVLSCANPSWACPAPSFLNDIHAETDSCGLDLHA